MSVQYAQVHILDLPYGVDRPFDYFVPAQLQGRVSRGSYVTVPFGSKNRYRMAVVFGLSDKKTDSKFDTKPIESLCSDEIRVTDEMFALCEFMQKQTLCTFGDAIKAMIPTSAVGKLSVFFSLPQKNGDETQTAPTATAENCSMAALAVYEFISSKGRVSKTALNNKFGAAKVAEALTELTEKSFVEKTVESEGGMPNRTVSYIRLVCSEDEARTLIDGGTVGKNKLPSQKQRELLDSFLRIAAIQRKEDRDGGEETGFYAKVREADLIEDSGATHAQVQSLIKRGIFESERKIEWRNSYAHVKEGKNTDYLLNDEQATALGKLCEMSRSGKAGAALLHGITGSGKTCVMVKLIDDVLAQGKGVIVLLPEIALTPQSVEIFCSRYGKRVALIHSGLSAGERVDSFSRIRSGEADVVIGTRSAVFASVKNLGLIIIDEEHEHTYKSDSNPKYHARDIARFRCANGNALLLLSSATPSIESYRKAREGKYTLLKLTKRYGNACLPTVTVSDMRDEPKTGNATPLGNLLVSEMIKTYKNGEQSILFINRRGYNNFISCPTCGEAIKCPNCSVAMTYHTKRGTYSNGELRCHWCGARTALPKSCPSCTSSHLAKMGFGTQRIEEEIGKILPDASLLRMDTDSTSTKSAYDEILGKFRDHEADILIGTQMVTKGHNFPNVTLVGVLLADMSMYLDDYRANERTFSMLTQVIGRAGRAEKKGHAVIQTNNPDSDVIRLACNQDYETFYEQEIELRRALTFPPFCDIVLLTVTSETEKDVTISSTLLKSILDSLTAEEYCDVPTVMFGPFEAPVFRVDGKYRMRIIVKCVLNRRSREMFSTVLMDWSKKHKQKPILSIDFNPTSI